MLTVICTDAGAAQALMPVIKKIENARIYADADGRAQNIFKKEKIKFKLLGKKDPILIEGILLTSSTPIQYEGKKIVHYGREAQAWQLAKKTGIPSIDLLDKYGKETSLRYTDTKTGKPVLPDKILLPHEFAKKQMIQQGIPKEKLIVTGNPHFDNVNKKTGRLYAGRIVPVFLSSQRHMKMFGMNNLELLQIIKEAVMAEALIVVKPHPKDDEEVIKQYASAMQTARSVIDRTTDAEDLALSLSESEFCTGSSSTLLEFATRANKLAISIQPNQKQDDVVTNILNITPHAYNKEEALALIQRALQDKKFREHWKQQRKNYKSDSKATERVLEQLQ